MTHCKAQGTDSDAVLAAGLAGQAASAGRGEAEAAAAAELLHVLGLSEADVEAGRVRPVAAAIARLRGAAVRRSTALTLDEGVVISQEVV